MPLSIQTGAIASVDTAACTATVEIATGFISNPLPWLAARFGDTQVWSPPSVGEQVAVMCVDGELDQGVILPALCLAKPNGFATGEQGIRFADGSLLKQSAGVLSLTASNIQLNGNVSVAGTLNASGACVLAGINVSTHIHGGVETGGGFTTPALP